MENQVIGVKESSFVSHDEKFLLREMKIWLKIENIDTVCS